MSKITLLILAGSCYCHINHGDFAETVQFSQRHVFHNVASVCVFRFWYALSRHSTIQAFNFKRCLESFILHGCFWIVVKVSVSLIGFYSKHWNCMCKLPFYSLFLNIYFLFMVVLVTEKLVLHTFLYRYNTSSLQIVCVLFVCIVTEKLKTYFDTDSFLS